MTSPIDFAKHFALIREAHKISSATLASILVQSKKATDMLLWIHLSDFLRYLL